MTNAERARSAARISALAATPVALGVGSKLLSGKAFGILAAFGLIGAGVGLAIYALGGSGTIVDTSPATQTTASHPAPIASAPPTIAPTVESAIASPPTSAPPPPSVVKPKPTVSTSTSASVDTLALENAILERARGKLGSDPAGALVDLEAHRAQFPSGRLGAERELMAIDALKRLGRNAEAKARGEAFIAANPKSLYVERARKMIEGL